MFVQELHINVTDRICWSLQQDRVSLSNDVVERKTRSQYNVLMLGC